MITFVMVLVGGGVFAMQAMLPKGHDCAHCKVNQSKCCQVKPSKTHSATEATLAKPASGM
jgi:hypothetical protein